MRSILVPLFYLWLAGSIVVLIRRRVTNGSFGAPSTADRTTITASAEPFPPPPPVATDPLTAPTEPVATEHAAQDEEPPPPPPPPPPSRSDEGSVAVKPAPPAPTGEPAATLADALAGIAMPCDLMPLIVDRFDPRVAAFSAQGVDPATVGTAVADEFERLGFELTQIDVRTMNAARGADHVQIRLSSAGLDSAAAMELRFPSAHPEALVVELRLV